MQSNLRELVDKNFSVHMKGICFDTSVLATLMRQGGVRTLQSVKMY